MISPLSIEESMDNRDSLGKYLYEKLFSWLVFRLNTSIGNERGAAANTCEGSLEVLDIFGFEIFDDNSFE